jgi:cytochrome c biogenesis protein CcmG/thiol:disulfide interchange protein DsbE
MSKYSKYILMLEKGEKSLLPLIMVGLGLLLLGIVTYVYLVNSWANDMTIDSNETDQFTVVPIEVNFPAPELTLNDLDGNLINLTDFLGSVVMVNNWATWCPPCKAEMPTLQEFYSDHSQENFTILAIEAGDPIPDVKQFVSDNELTFPILLDPMNLALRAFQNDNLPSSYVIDRAGMVRLAWTGPISLEMLEKSITPLLEEK